MKELETIDFNKLDPDFKYIVSKLMGGENITHCFYCGICSVSCPVRKLTDEYNPRKIIRMVLYGMKEELLSSKAIWMCVHCHTCYERCPQNVKFAEVIEAIKSIAIKEAKKGNIRLNGIDAYFDSCFAENIKENGRLFETGLLIKIFMKRKSMKFMTFFSSLGLKMFKKGLLNFKPNRVAKMNEIKKLYEGTEE